MRSIVKRHNSQAVVLAVQNSIYDANHCFNHKHLSQRQINPSQIQYRSKKDWYMEINKRKSKSESEIGEDKLIEERERGGWQRKKERKKENKSL